MAGRGFGKTRCGAEWVRAEVKAGRRRIALVAPTAADARDVMVEGESGILAISPDHERPLYEPSKRRLTWRNGAVATTFSADEPERLRGPQHDAAWCDDERWPPGGTPRPGTCSCSGCAWARTRGSWSPRRRGQPGCSRAWSPIRPSPSAGARPTRTAPTSPARSSSRSSQNTRAPGSAARN